MWFVDRKIRQQPNTHPEQWATDGANEPARPSATAACAYYICVYSWSECLMSSGERE